VERLKSTDYDKAISFFQSIGMKEGDELNPKEYRTDNEEDGSQAIIFWDYKLWYAPDGHWIETDYFGHNGTELIATV
jgi:hypothetical protein